MTKKTLSEAFEVKNRTFSPKDDVVDYDIFANKNLLEELRTKIVQNLVEENIPSDELLEDYINNEIDKTLVGYDLSTLERRHVFNLIQNEITGYGPITSLLKDNAITEIMVNAPNEIYVEIDGKIAKDETVSFINDDHIIRTIQRMIQPLGRTIDTASPMVDARLADGSRLNAVIPPLSLNGPVLTIRKFKEDLANIELDRVMLTHSIAPESRDYLEQELLKIIPQEKLMITEAGSIISSHCGRGTIGILYIVK